MMRSFLVLLFICSYTISFSEAAPGTIAGSIIDGETLAPLPYASVALYSSIDKSLITGTITGEDGTFNLPDISPGVYYLEITFIGYEKKVIENVRMESGRAAVNLGKVELPRSVKTLEAIEVVADEMSVAYKIDRKVINVSQQLTAASGSAVDILQNLPSITVDVEGNVALRGSTGFMVLIDGRPTVLEASEALQQIPANTIENIEIITNPSAKYNPDGTSGIINIVTKKNKLQGLSGTGNLNAGNFNRYGGGLLFNYTRKKWSIFLGADYNKGTRPQQTFDERTTQKIDTTFSTRSSGPSDRNRKFWVVRGGVDYSISAKDFLNLEFNYGFWGHNWNSTLAYREIKLPGDFDNSYTSFELGSRSGNFYSINSSYQHDFKGKGHNLIAQIQYRYRDGEDISNNQLIDVNGEVTSGQRNSEIGPGATLQTNLDYVLPVGEFHKFEAGYQSRFGRSQDKTELYWLDPQSGNYDLQTQFSNDTDYTRDIHAIYGIYGGTRDKLGYQIGLRGEYTYRIIRAKTNPNDFTLKRLDYFPTLHISYNLPSDQQFMLSYSRRIERPRSWFLEPFITWTDAFNVRQGNPGLRPEYINAMEFAYLNTMGEHSLSIEGYYRIANNKTERIRSVYQENVMLSRPENVGQDYALGIETVLSLNLFKWWKMDLSGNVFDYRLRGSLNDQVFNRQSFNWNTRLTNTFRVLEGNRIQLNSRYNSATVTAQGIDRGYWTADIAISQEFWKKRMTGILQVRDMFGKVIREYESSGVNFTSMGYQYNIAPQVSITLNYRFNNYKKEKGERDGGDDDGDEF